MTDHSQTTLEILARQDAVVPLDVALAALPGIVERCPSKSTVRSWRRRNVLAIRATRDGVPLYRLGDILRLAVDASPRPGRTRYDVPWFDETKPVGYTSAHRHVTEDRGPATEWPCVDCGKGAQHWSYDHLDPNQLISGQGCWYSLDIDRYEARCASCHMLFDASYRRGACFL